MRRYIKRFRTGLIFVQVFYFKFGEDLENIPLHILRYTGFGECNALGFSYFSVWEPMVCILWCPTLGAHSGSYAPVAIF